MRHLFLTTALTLTAPMAFAEVQTAEVLTTYANIAEAGFADSLATAKTLQAAVDALIADPSEANLQAAKDAWLASRIPYQPVSYTHLTLPTIHPV